MDMVSGWESQHVIAFANCASSTVSTALSAHMTQREQVPKLSSRLVSNVSDLVKYNSTDDSTDSAPLSALIVRSLCIRHVKIWLKLTLGIVPHHAVLG